LALGVPLSEGVAKRQHPFFGPRFVLVPARPAEGCIEAECVDGVEQRGRLEPVARRDRTRVRHPSLVDGLLHARHHQAHAERLDQTVAVLEDLGEVVPVSTCMTGKGSLAGWKALTARCKSTAESLPPLNSSTGRSHSAATSRRMKMAWDSRRSRCDIKFDVASVSGVTVISVVVMGVRSSGKYGPWTAREVLAAPET